MAGFYVGHGRHWEFFREGGRPDSDLIALFYEVHRTAQVNTRFQAGDVRLLCEPDADLGIGLLVQGQKIASAFPYASGGHVWPIVVRDRHEWPNPIEAQLTGSCHGARVSWFDPHYAANRGRYGTGEPLGFRMNALAYRVWRTRFADPEQEERMGGAKVYLPLSDQGDFVASEDEVQFMSHVEGVREIDFHGVPFDVYTLTLAQPDDFPMRLDVFTPRAAAEERLTVGDRISGVCWLFGVLAD